MMVLEVREARDKGSINQHGHFQGLDVMGLEVHVKDEKRFPGKWAFFDFDKPTSNGTLIPSGASCYTCHAASAMRGRGYYVYAVLSYAAAGGES